MALLPIGEALTRALYGVTRQRQAAIRTARRWYFIQTGAMLLGLALGGPVTLDTALLTGGQVFAVIAGVLTQLVGLPAVAIDWHRFALLGEQPTTQPFLPPHFLRYVWTCIAICLQAAILTLVGMIVAGSVVDVTDDTAPATWISIVILASAATLGLTGVKLPGAALGRPTRGSQAVVVTAGNLMRAAVCALLIGAAYLLPMIFISGIGLKLGGVLGPTLIIVAGNAIEYAGVLVAASFLNNLYVFLDGRGPNGEELTI